LCGATRAPLHRVAIPNDRNSTLKASERTIADMSAGADMSASSRRHLPSHPTAPAHYTLRKPPFFRDVHSVSVVATVWNDPCTSLNRSTASPIHIRQQHPTDLSLPTARPRRHRGNG